MSDTQAALSTATVSWKTAFSRLYRFLCSTELAIALFLALCLLAIPGTLSETRKIYSSAPFVTLLALLGLSTFACTLRRIRTLAVPVVIVHVGVLLLLGGGVLRSHGFVATVNVYEGTSVDKAYRWDLAADVPLGMELTVKRINAQFSAPAKVGVLKGGEEYALFTINPGESFKLGEYWVTGGDFDTVSENLYLTVFRQGRRIGCADTSGKRDLPADFPYDFRLVAFKKPFLKRTWLDLEVSRDSRSIAQGTSEINGPFQWEGLNIYHVRTAKDPTGRAYAGIQIVRDPGRPLVFFGFAVLALGTLLAFLRRACAKSGLLR